MLTEVSVSTTVFLLEAPAFRGSQSRPVFSKPAAEHFPVSLSLSASCLLVLFQTLVNPWGASGQPSCSILRPATSGLSVTLIPPCHVL